MAENDFSVTVCLERSNCVECGHSVDRASGPVKPEPGDKTLCIRCGSLNVFDDAMLLRRPTYEEYLEVAASSEFQEARRRITALNAMMRHRDEP